MDYEQALKKVTAEKAKENRMVFTLSYDKKIILPHKAGLQLMDALMNGELLTENYNKPPQITGLLRDSIAIQTLSDREYLRIKVAQLLNVSVHDLPGEASQ